MASPGLTERRLGPAVLAMGSLALVFSLLPGIGFVSYVLGGAAAVLGLIEAIRHPVRGNRGMAIAGAILGAMAIVVATGVLTDVTTTSDVETGN